MWKNQHIGLCSFVLCLSTAYGFLNIHDSFPTKTFTQQLRMSTTANVEQIRGSDKEGLLDLGRLARAAQGPGVRFDGDQKLKIGIIGAGLAGMITAMDLSEAGHEVDIYEARRFPGGKVGSWKDKDGNHIEMGLHVFFGCYYNLFGIFKRLGVLEKHLRLKEHTHTFVNKGGKLGALDFRFGGIGAPINGLKAFATTEQLDLGDKAANAIALATSPVVRALIDFDGAMEDIRALDGISFSDWFIGKGGSRGSIDRMWDPIAYALGFIDCDHISARCMLTIFNLFAVRSEASVLRMLEGSPEEYIHKPIISYLEERGVNLYLNRRVQNLIYDTETDQSTGKEVPTRIRGFSVSGPPGATKEEAKKVAEDALKSAAEEGGATGHLVSAEADGGRVQTKEYDVVVAACDVPGIQKLLPQDFRSLPFFDNVYKLEAVPVATVQLRFNGWVTELADDEAGKKRRNTVDGDFSDGKAPGLDNLLYSADAEFSCFADLALASPADYYKEGEGSLLQCVLTPGDKWMPENVDKIAEETLKQVHALFPSSRDLKCTWTNVVKLGQSLYREAPGVDVFRPKQKTPVENFYLAGSYTYQDYIDSMEGATKSGIACADEVLADTPAIANKKRATAAGSKAEPAVAAA